MSYGASTKGVLSKSDYSLADSGNVTPQRRFRSFSLLTSRTRNRSSSKSDGDQLRHGATKLASSIPSSMSCINLSTDIDALLELSQCQPDASRPPQPEHPLPTIPDGGRPESIPESIPESDIDTVFLIGQQQSLDEAFESMQSYKPERLDINSVLALAASPSHPEFPPSRESPTSGSNRNRNRLPSLPDIRAYGEYYFKESNVFPLHVYINEDSGAEDIEELLDIGCPVAYPALGSSWEPDIANVLDLDLQKLKNKDEDSNDVFMSNVSLNICNLAELEEEPGLAAPRHIIGDFGSMDIDQLMRAGEAPLDQELHRSLEPEPTPAPEPSLKLEPRPISVDYCQSDTHCSLLTPVDTPSWPLTAKRKQRSMSQPSISSRKKSSSRYSSLPVLSTVDRSDVPRPRDEADDLVLLCSVDIEEVLNIGNTHSPDGGLLASCDAIPGAVVSVDNLSSVPSANDINQLIEIGESLDVLLGPAPDHASEPIGMINRISLTLRLSTKGPSLRNVPHDQEADKLLETSML